MKNIYLLFFSFFSTLALAQEQPKNPFHLGFEFGIETQTLGIQPLDDKTPEETAVSPARNRTGARLGLVAEKRIWRGLSFQSGLALSTTHNGVIFRPGGQSRYRFTDLELPVYFSVTNQKGGRLPLRGKVLFGPRLGWNMAQNSGDKLQFLRERLALDLGLGVEIELGKWRICPEAIYSHGLNNLHDFTGTDFDFLVGRTVRDKLAFRIVLLRAK